MWEKHAMETFDAFKNHLLINGTKPQSVAVYQTYVFPFLEFASGREPQSCIWEYLQRYKREATKKTAWTHIKIFVRWCASIDIGQDWTAPFHFHFAKPPPPPVLSPVEFHAILEAIPKTRQGRRDRACLAVIYYTGARRTAITSLRREDINIPDRIIRIMTKGDKEQYIPLPRPAADELNSWLAFSAKLNSPFAFPSLRTPKTRSIHPVYMTHALPLYAKAAGIQKRVFVHLLRHSFATELHAADVPLETIQGLLGHSRLSTTEGYVRQLGSALKARSASDRVFGKAA